MINEVFKIPAADLDRLREEVTVGNNFRIYSLEIPHISILRRQV